MNAEVEETACSKVDKVEIVHQGKWLNTQLIKYTDPQGTQREWEAVGYANKLSNASTPNSVQVVAVLKRRLRHNCFVLVKQFRPPLGCCCIEFPAGLVDENDQDAGAAALRELHEETGFVGTICDGPELKLLTSLDPGCETSTITTVCVSIDGDDHQNINSVQHLDDGEFIKVVVLPARDIFNRLNLLVKDSAEKIVIDSRLYAFAIGLHFGACLSNYEKPLEIFS